MPVPIDIFGGSMCFAAGLFSLIFAVLVIKLPVKPGADFSKWMPALAANRNLYVSCFATAALEGLAGIAVVPAVTRMVRGGPSGLLEFATALGLLGYGLWIVSNVRSVSLAPMRARFFVSGDDSLKKAIEGSPTQIDPHMWITLGGVAFWLIVVSVLGLSQGSIPTALALAGIVLAGFLGIAVGGLALQMPPLIMAAAYGGKLLLAPIWYVWFGLSLLGAIQPAR